MRKRLTAALLCFMMIIMFDTPAFAAADAGLIVTPAQWRGIGLTGGYTLVYDGGLWGYIDDKGNVAIEPQFDFARDFHEGFALTKKVVQGKVKTGFIGTDGNMKIDLDGMFESLSGAGDFSSGLAPVYLDNGRTYYIDTRGKIALRYSSYAGGFYDGLAKVPTSSGYGYIDKNGDFAIPPSFDEAWNFEKGRALVRKGGLFGVIDKTGNYIIEPVFEDVALSDQYFSQRLFSNGLAAVKINGKWGAVNASGQFVIQAKYDGFCPFANGYAAVRLNGGWGLVDVSGKTVAEPVFDNVTEPVNGMAFLKLNGQYSLYSIDTMEKLDFDTEGWTNVVCAGDHFVYEKDGMYGITITKSQPSSWAKNDVSEAIGLSLVDKDMQNSYTQDITRLDFCRLALNLLEVKTGMGLSGIVSRYGTASASFSDTSDGDVLAAAAIGIVNGRPDGTFGPDEFITRQEAAAMLTRTAKILSGMETGTPLSFSDAGDVSDWAMGYVDFVSSNGIMTGDTSGKFLPLSFYTREQAIVTVLRLYKLL